MSVDVRIERDAGGWTATVRVGQEGRSTEHRVTVRDDDLERYTLARTRPGAKLTGEDERRVYERSEYGATDAADLVRRSFAFLLEREPNTSILREFRITEIERYFPEYAATIRRGGDR